MLSTINRQTAEFHDRTRGRGGSGMVDASALLGNYAEVSLETVRLPTGTLEPRSEFNYEFRIDGSATISELQAGPETISDYCVANNLRAGTRLEMVVTIPSSGAREEKQVCLPLFGGGGSRSISGIGRTGTDTTTLEVTIRGAKSGTVYLERTYDVDVADDGGDGGDLDGGDDPTREEPSGSSGPLADLIARIREASDGALLGGFGVLLVIVIIAVLAP